jgi:PAS domain-containing protein
MSIETVTSFLYVWLSISLIFPAIAIWITYKNRTLKATLAKQNLANRYYEEMLYASKDGYLTISSYKNKEYQYCSRRLATMLNLKNGENSTLTEIISVFNKEDADQIYASFYRLKNTGLSFELIAQSKNNKIFTINGVRINSSDSEVSSDCLWFQDITTVTTYINNVTNEAALCRQQLEDFRILIDNLPCPVWLRDNNLDISILNRKYLELLGLKEFKDINKDNINLHDLGNTTNLLDLAKNAKQSNNQQKKQINILSNGELKKYEITETPYYDSSLKTSHTIGSLIDITSFDEAKRNYQVHLDSHLDILSSLDTAFCIINTQHNFTFGNTAFLKMWNLPENFIENAPHYNLFLDKIREQKSLPEVSDFKAYKEEENKAFDAITDQKEDLLYIPDGRTFRRIRAPHPDGTIIVYEDITERLATTRKLNDLASIQQSILNNIYDSVAIFSPNMKLKTYNVAFLNQWQIQTNTLDNQPYLRDILDLQKTLLPEVENWNDFREDMLKHITSCTPFTLKLKNKQKFKVTPLILADSSLMITYHKE